MYERIFIDDSKDWKLKVPSGEFFVLCKHRKRTYYNSINLTIIQIYNTYKMYGKDEKRANSRHRID